MASAPLLPPPLPLMILPFNPPSLPPPPPPTFITVRNHLLWHCSGGLGGGGAGGWAGRFCIYIYTHRERPCILTAKTSLVAKWPNCAEKYICVYGHIWKFSYFLQSAFKMPKFNVLTKNSLLAFKNYCSFIAVLSLSSSK